MFLSQQHKERQNILFLTMHFSLLTLLRKRKSKQIKDVNVEPKTTKLLEENWGKAQDIGVRNYISSKAQIVKHNMGQKSLMGLWQTLRSLCTVEMN